MRNRERHRKRMKAREEEGIHCFLSAGKGQENDVIRQKANKENRNSEKNRLKKGKRDSVVQAGLYRYHPAICIQPPCSGELKDHLHVPAFFLLPGEEICSAEDRWHCHCLCSCGGFFQMGSWKLLCAAPAFLCSSPRVLGAPPACRPGGAQTCAAQH